MQRFAGFPQGSAPSAAIFPAQFFSELLPLIDDLAELKVTLFCFHAISQQEGRFRCLRRADFLKDEPLRRSLHACDPAAEAESVLDSALDRAAARGTLLTTSIRLNGAEERLYLVNTVNGRLALEQLKAGLWVPAADESIIEILPERPNIYRLYESNIGPLTPMIADALKDAGLHYPPEVIADAIREAVKSNKRSWRYIDAILKRWEIEGRDGQSVGRSAEPDGKKYIQGKYADFIKS
jgi:DnaD/phage-associated family protein